jgi:hypothetical protein
VLREDVEDVVKLNLEEKTYKMLSREDLEDIKGYSGTNIE